MHLRRALTMTTLAAFITASMLGVVLLAAESPHDAAMHETARRIIEATDGRADPTFIAIVVILVTAFGGTLMAGTVIHVMNKLIGRHLDQSREDNTRALSAFERQMDTERSFHQSQIEALIEHDERHHAELTTTLAKACAEFTAEVRAARASAEKRA